MKYCIQELKRHGKNAGTKAVRDVAQILSSHGYQNVNIIGKFPFLSLLKLYCILKQGDIVVVQWPFYGFFADWMFKVIKNKQTRLILLLHDINSVRNIKNKNLVEDNLLTYAEKVVVHSEAMKLLLERAGFDSSKMSVLTSFDYLTNDTFVRRQYSSTVVYAGNLTKSVFLQNIPKECFGVRLNCYGLPVGVIPQYLTYKGAFMPENVSIIEGSWGLVWDGDSENTCSGNYGEYLKINAPHKVSLYIVAGLPIIIWQKAALAKYVVDNNLGIAIESLNDLSVAISSVSIERYNAMVNAIEQEANVLKTGGHLLTVIYLDC